MGVIDELLAKDPEVREVVFCRDRAALQALSDAHTELAAARAERATCRPAQRDEAEAKVAAAEAAVEERVAEVAKHLIRFRFAAVGAETFEQLKADHPPDKRATSSEWSESMQPALVAAACIGVETPSGEHEGLSLEDAHRMWVSPAYNESERAELFNAALAATLTRTLVPLQSLGAS